jgi:signal transduction histidine kinase/ligand-binding sensor domain-containing protein
MEDSSGNLWIGSDDAGISVLDPSTEEFSHYQHIPEDPHSLSDNNVRAIFEGENGDLWVGTHGGLNLFDSKTSNFQRFQHDPGSPTSLGDNKVSAILEDDRGNLWVCTEGGGLDLFDRDKQAFIHHANDPENPGSISHDRVRSIFQDHSGRLWVGTQDGLNHMELAQDRFTHFRHDPSDPTSLSSSSIWSIYEDRAGVLWFGTYGGGVSKVNPITEQFLLYKHNPGASNTLSENMIWSILEDREGILWIGTFNGGLNRLDRSTNTFTLYQHDPEDPDTISSNDVRALLEDQEGTLWIGTSNGLNKYNPNSQTFTHYQHDPNDENSLSENRVTVLLEDAAGNLWIGTRSEGVVRWDPSTDTFERYQHNPSNGNSICDDRVWSLHQDSAKRIWVGTLGGLYLLDEFNEISICFANDPDNPQSLNNDAIFAINEDLNDTIWIGTWGGGLDRFNPDSQSFTHFTEKNGLPNNVIYGIEVDSEGYLWMSTNWGLAKFDPLAETFSNYDFSDGLQDNEFNVGAHSKGVSGELFFGGIRGFNAFIPEEIKANSFIPPIVVTEIQILNETYLTSISEPIEIELPYEDNFLSFDFAALDYTAPSLNQYAYMMEGLDQDWVEVENRHHADYPNLRYGEYVFRVKGSNNDGIWNEEGLAINITIKPPVWATWWFRVLVALVILGSFVYRVRQRVRNAEAHSKELEILIDERTSQIERRTNELEALYSADAELHRHLDLEELLEVLVGIAVDILKADKSSLMVWDEQYEMLVLRVAQGFSPETMARMSFKSGEGNVGLVATTGEPIIVEDTHKDPRVIRSITDPEGIRSFMQVPIKIGEQVFGVFSADYCESRGFGIDEQKLFIALAQRAASAIQNAQLYEQAQELAVVEDRSRLARDLHDAVTQTLFSASLIAEVLPRIWDQNQEEGERRLEELRELTRGALAEMRTLLLELRPASLAEADLGDLLRQLTESITGRSRIPVTLEVSGECDLPPSIKIAFYRIAQEALNNVAKHAGANQATVSLICDQKQSRLRVSDDGRGFDLEDIPLESLGVGIMRERAITIDAHLEINSEVGHGTSVEVVWGEV